jgi:hypothetical protein
MHRNDSKAFYYTIEGSYEEEPIYSNAIYTDGEEEVTESTYKAQNCLATPLALIVTSVDKAQYCCEVKLDKPGT